MNKPIELKINYNNQEYIYSLGSQKGNKSKLGIFTFYIAEKRDNFVYTYLRGATINIGNQSENLSILNKYKYFNIFNMFISYKKGLNRNSSKGFIVLEKIYDEHRYIAYCKNISDFTYNIPFFIRIPNKMFNYLWELDYKK